MTGRTLYDLYSREMAKLPSYITRNEALPAWDFIGRSLQSAWDDLGVQLQLAPKPKPKPKPQKKPKPRYVRTSTTSRASGLYGGGDK